MAVASDYPITFPFGATSAPYSPQSPHKGEDRVMPIGTPVLINGIKIGESGNTGYSTGAHLHIGKYTQNGTLMPPNGQGFSFNNAKVITVASDSSNGNYVRILGDGYCYIYCHLSKQTCAVGQILAQPAPVIKEDLNIMDKQAVRYAYLAVNDSEPTPDQLNYWTGRRPAELNEALYRASELRRFKANRYDELVLSIDNLQQQLTIAQNQLRSLPVLPAPTTTISDVKPAEAPVRAPDKPEKPNFLVLFVANLLKKK